MRKLNAKQKAYLRMVGKDYDMYKLESMNDFETIYQEAERYIHDNSLYFEKCWVCGKKKKINSPCTCKFGSVMG